MSFFIKFMTWERNSFYQMLLFKFQYTEVINQEVKPSRSHQMTQKMQISDFLVDKCKKLLHIKKQRSF